MIKKMPLNIERKWTALNNVMREKQEQRNTLIDVRKARKKSNLSVEQITKEIDKLGQELVDMRNSANAMENEFDRLSRKMGYIRLKNYVLADAIYGNLIEYKDFIEKECQYNDTDVVSRIESTIDMIKALPFECGDSENDRFREVFNAISDAFIEKQDTILEGIFNQVMIELERDESSKIRK